MRKHSDRLSELPESLIHHVLSFLPMTDVVSTTILSKRWNNLWTTVPCLNFSYDFDSEKVNRAHSHSVRNFVNRVLMFWRRTKILKFEIAIHNLYDLSFAGDFDLWVRFAVEYKVEDLSIDLSYLGVSNWEDSEIEDAYWAPQCLNSCSSIRKLSLKGCNLQINGSPTWNQLKSLIVDGFGFGGGLTNQILSGSPRLEVFELSFVENFADLDIQSTNLKKLKINKYCNEFGYNSSRPLLRICCPNLEILEISGLLYDKYFLTNVVSSLTDAILGFYEPLYDNDDDDDGGGIVLLGEKIWQILPTIQHVDHLALSSTWCVKGFLALLKKYLLSPFPNVKFLKLEVCNIEVSDMTNLLGIFPNVMMLVIDDYGGSPEKLLEFEIELSNSFLLRLKTIHITSPLSDPSIFGVIELLLKHATMLEKLVIRKWGMGSRKFPVKAAKKLLSMPRSSPTAQVIIKSKRSSS
ncbi:hypothetical protein ACS0TY_035558 [Phlomoides rotata]